METISAVILVTGLKWYYIVFNTVLLVAKGLSSTAVFLLSFRYLHSSKAHPRVLQGYDKWNTGNGRGGTTIHNFT